ncbi:hypothetical protein GDO81_022629, partial [Engystomops pustulosus]
LYYQNVWEKHQLLYQKLTEDRRRHRRSANGNRKSKNNNRKSSTVTAAHYEVKFQKEGKMNADDNGTILHWMEVPRNSTNPVKYDAVRGEFIVNVKGLFYLYCQVRRIATSSFLLLLLVSSAITTASSCHKTSPSLVIWSQDDKNHSSTMGYNLHYFF